MLRPLGDFLNRAINKTGAKRSIDATLIVESVAPLLLQIIPELRRGDFDVISYRNGVLTVAVVNPTVGHEIASRAEAILDVLRDTFSEQQFLRLRTIPLVVPDDGF